MLGLRAFSKERSAIASIAAKNVGSREMRHQIFQGLFPDTRASWSLGGLTASALFRGQRGSKGID